MLTKSQTDGIINTTKEIRKEEKEMKNRVITEYRVYENEKIIATYTKKKFATMEAKKGANRVVKKVQVLSTDF